MFLVVDYSQYKYDELLVCHSDFWKRNNGFSSNHQALEKITAGKYKFVGLLDLTDHPNLPEINKVFEILETGSVVTNINFDVYGGRASNPFYSLDPKLLAKWFPDWEKAIASDNLSNMKKNY